MKWLLLILLLIATCAEAQDTLTVGVTTPLSTFSLTTDPTPIQTTTVKTDWNMSFSWSITVCAFMTMPMTGTGANTDSIPASAVQLNGTSIVSSSTSCGVVGARQLWSSIFVFGSGSKSYSMNFGLAGFPALLAPDTYTGTITFVAVAY